MKQLARLGVLLAFTIACVACHGIGGTYDHSRSLNRSGAIGDDGAIAIIGPPETAELPGLSDTLGRAVREAVATNAPSREVLDASQFYELLQRHKGYLEHFGGWLARYAQTGVAETKHQPSYAKATGVRYLVILKDAKIRRERLDVQTAMQESGCGFGCTIADVNNIWGNRLLVIAELHDLRAGKILWKGVGEANAITSRVSRLDFGLVRYNLAQPNMGAYSSQLVAHVANGIVREMGPKRPGGGG